MGDRVFMSYGLGYPLILGFMPKTQGLDGSTPLPVDSGDILVDTGNYSPAETTFVADMNKPQDLVSGDRAISSTGGAFTAWLRGGSLVLRSGKVAEVFMSRLMGLIRVFSPNWEHFTAAFSDVVKSVSGRVYRYTGYAMTKAEATIEKYRYRTFQGDVAAGEELLTDYNTTTLTAPPGTLISKEQIVDFPEGTPRELMRRTLNISGEKEVWIWNGDHFTRVTSTPEQLKFAWNDQNFVVITEASIHAVHKDGADVILDANGIRATFADGVINMSTSGIDSNFSGSDVNLTAGAVTVTKGASTGTFTDSDITLSSGAGTALVSDGLTRISNGGHMVAVTSGGVAIS
jgi:hypothetical protein